MAEKAVIITGAADGLGRATSIAAARAGYAVLLVDIDEARLEVTARLVREAGGEAIIAKADVSNEDDVAGYVAKAVAAFGRIDGLFNNAGIQGAIGPIVNYSAADFDRVIAINLKGVFLGLKHVLQVMLRQGSGSIVNTGSMLSTGGVPGFSGYGAAKYGVISLTKTAALEVAKRGVRVNAVLPGNIKTKMSLGSTARGSEAESEAMAASMVPQGRMGTADEIADAVLFLFSDASKHITGIELAVDGGITAQVYPNVGI
jgi:NAD(P)-dependent dehydrogenase (short-subunit alcohol dehydrogenase family)